MTAGSTAFPSTLVVDDNSYVRQMARAMLITIGVRNVVEAEDGEEALARFVKAPTGLVLLDHMMPGMNGCELTRRLRDEDTSPNPLVPIIMMSGYTDRPNVLAARDAGITEYVAKPMSVRSLADRILNALNNPRPFVRTPTFFGPDRRRFVHPNYAQAERRARTEEVTPPQR
jgi:CheY-like chemotaxis protein